MMQGLRPQLNIAAVRWKAVVIAMAGDKETADLLVLLTDIVQQQSFIIEALIPKELNHGRNAEDQAW